MLHVAAEWMENLANIQLLLDRGADPTILDAATPEGSGAPVPA